MHSQEGRGRSVAAAWGQAAPTRGPKPRHDYTDIAAAAIELADRDGLASLSLAAVAESLGIATTALYRYVDSKAELIELMVDAAVGAPPELGPGGLQSVPAPGRSLSEPAPSLGSDWGDDRGGGRGDGHDWHSDAERWALALWERYRRHPWLGQVEARGAPRFPHQLAWMESLLAALENAPLEDAMALALLLDGVARAFCLIGVRESTPAPPWLNEAVARRFPRVAAKSERDWEDIDDEYRRAVTVVLRGIQRR